MTATNPRIQTAGGIVPVVEPGIFRNRIINGGFDIWQRGTSQTSAGYGSDDRWINDHNGSTKTASQQIFTLGQTDVPNSAFFSRTVVTSVAGVGNYVNKLQKIEDVRTLAGRTVTISFYAKADAAKNIALELIQYFGTGGSPSSPVTGIGVTTVALTTAWVRYSVTVTIPSISGKTLGSDANSSSTALVFWFEAGSNLNARTNSLGQQSGTFDIAQVQLEPGTVATPFEFRPYGTELALCQRYYEVGGQNRLYLGGVLTGIGTAYDTIFFKVTKRADNPTISVSGFEYYNGGSGTAFTPTLPSAPHSATKFYYHGASLTNWNGWTGAGTWTASSEL